MLKSAFISPHAPVMIPSIGKKGGIKGMNQTINAILNSSLEIAKLEPEVIVIMSQRGYIIPNAISVQIPANEELFGSMSDFGEEDCVGVKSDNDLAMRILNTVDRESLNIIGQDNNNLDYGMVIPLYYLQKACKKKFKVVALSMSLESKQKHFDFGKILNRIFKESDKNIVFIATAELSHTLSKNAPQGYVPEAKKLDKNIVKYIKEEKTCNFLLLDPFKEDECVCHGLRPISTLLGVVENQGFTQHNVSYESPYGVGYLTILFK